MRTPNVSLTSGRQALAVALLALSMGCNLVIAADDVPDPGFPEDAGPAAEADGSAAPPDGGDPIFHPDAAAPGADAATPADAAVPPDAAAPAPDAASPGADAGPDASSPGPDASTSPDAGCAPVVPSSCTGDEWTCSGGATPQSRYASGACWEPTSGSGDWCCTPSCDEAIPATSCVQPTPRQIDCSGSANLAADWSYEEADCKTTGSTSCCPTAGYREMDGGTACAPLRSATLHLNGLSSPPYSNCEHGDGGATWCCEPECLDRGADSVACPTAPRPVLLECAGNKQPSGSLFTNCAAQTGGRRGNYCCDVPPDAGTSGCSPSGGCGTTGTLYSGCSAPPSGDCTSVGGGDYCCGDTPPPDSGMPKCNPTGTPCGNGGAITTCDPGAPAPPGCNALGGNDYCCGETATLDSGMPMCTPTGTPCGNGGTITTCDPGATAPPGCNALSGNDYCCGETIAPDAGTTGSCFPTGNTCGSGGTEVSCPTGVTPGASCTQTSLNVYCCGGTTGTPDAGGATTGCSQTGTFCQTNTVHTVAFTCAGSSLPSGACYLQSSGQYCCIPGTATACGTDSGATCTAPRTHAYACMGTAISSGSCTCTGPVSPDPAQHCCCPN